MKKFQICKVVDEELLKEDDNDPIAAESDGFDVGAEGQLADTPALVVIPDHHLVRRILRLRTTSDERKDVAAEEHLNNADSTAVDGGGGVEGAAEDLAEGVGVVDAEAGGGGDGEAGEVLVEGEREEGDRGSGFGFWFWVG